MKYKVKYDWKDQQEQSRYIVSIIGVMNDETTKVKDKSQGLKPEFYGKTVCKVYDDGNSIKINVGGKELQLDYAEEQDVLTALLARAEKEGYKIKIKEKV